MQIIVALKGSYAIKLKIILENLVILMVDISDKTKAITDVTNNGEIKFVPVDWILMLQMMLQLKLNIKVDVVILMLEIMIWNVMLEPLLGMLLFNLGLDLKMQFAPF